MPDHCTIVAVSRLRAVGPFRATVSGGVALPRTNVDAPPPVARPAPDDGGALCTMLASEAALAAEWATPQEDAAWADL